METNLEKSNQNLVEGQDCILGEEITIFLLDCSGSMNSGFADIDYPDNNWANRTSKFQAMINAATAFANQRVASSKNGALDRVGVIAFGNRGARVVFNPINTNFASMGVKVANLQCGGGTPMSDAVSAAIKLSENFPTAFLRLVILSDGQPDYRLSVFDAVRSAYEDYGLVTDTIGIGNKNYSDVSASPCGLDENFLIKVAELGGGKYTRCTDAESLTNLFLEIEQERALLMGKGILLLGDGNNIK